MRSTQSIKRINVAGVLAIGLVVLTLVLWVPGARLAAFYAPILVGHERSSEMLWHLKVAGMVIGGTGLVLVSLAVPLALVLRNRFPRWFRIILVLLPGLGVLVGLAFFVGAVVKHALR